MNVPVKEEGDTGKSLRRRRGTTGLLTGVSARKITPLTGGLQCTHSDGANNKLIAQDLRYAWKMCVFVCVCKRERW